MTDDDDDIDDDETNRPEQVWNQFKFDGVLAVDLLGNRGPKPGRNTRSKVTNQQTMAPSRAPQAAQTQVWDAQLRNSS